MLKIIKTLTFSIICSLIFATIIPPKNANAETLLTIEQAKQMAIKNSDALREADMEINKKNLEILQATQAVKAHIAKQFGLFALIFKKDFNLDTDLKYKLEVPTKRMGYNEKVKEKEKKEREIKAEIESLYYSTYVTMVDAQIAQKTYEEAKKHAEDVAVKQRIGLSTRDDVEAAKEIVKTLESAVKTAQLAYKANRLQLGEKLGVNLEFGYTFDVKPSSVDLSHHMIWVYLDHALKNDFNVYKEVENRKLIELRIKETVDLYKENFVLQHSIVTNMLPNGPGEFSPIDQVNYDKFLKNYDKMLELIHLEWEGFIIIPIPTPFGIIPIPLLKKWLQGEYQGLRYFEDSKFSLPVSMMELDKQRLKEKMAKEALIANVKKGYIDTKSAEEAYIQAILNREKEKKKYQEGQIKNKMGLLDKEKLAELKESEAQAVKNATNAMIGYQTALTQFNVMTSGALNSYFKPGMEPSLKVDDGLTPLNIAKDDFKPIIGSWEITSVAKDVTSNFSIKIGKTLGATHYELQTSSGVLIDKRMPIDGKILHLDVTFSNIRDLKVNLYKGETLVGEGLLDGYGTSGTLKITKK